MINDGCLLSCAETNSDDKGTDMRRQGAPCHQVHYPIYASLMVPLWVVIGQVACLEARYVCPPHSPYLSAYRRQACLFLGLLSVILPVSRLV